MCFFLCARKHRAQAGRAPARDPAIEWRSIKKGLSMTISSCLRRIHLLALPALLLFVACGKPPPPPPPAEADSAEVSETRYPDETAPKLERVPKGSVVATMGFKPTEKVVTDKPCLRLDLLRTDQGGKKPFLKNLSVRGREIHYAPGGNVDYPDVAFKVVIRKSDVPKIEPLQTANKLTFKCTQWGKSEFTNKAPSGFVELKVPFKDELYPDFDAPTCSYLSFQGLPKNAKRSKRYKVVASATTTLTGKSAIKANRESGRPFLSALTIQVPKAEALNLNKDMAENRFGLKCVARRKKAAFGRF